MRKTLMFIAWGLAAVVAAWLLLHVVIAPVNPRQPVPEKHVSAPCWTCHTVSSSVEIR